MTIRHNDTPKDLYDDYIAHRAYIQKAIAKDPFAEPEETITELLFSRKAYLITAGGAFIIVEFLIHKITGEKSLHVRLAGGPSNQTLGVFDSIGIQVLDDLCHEYEYDFITLVGRKGWIKYLAQYGFSIDQDYITSSSKLVCLKRPVSTK